MGGVFRATCQRMLVGCLHGRPPHIVRPRGNTARRPSGFVGILFRHRRTVFARTLIRSDGVQLQCPVVTCVTVTVFQFFVERIFRIY